MIDWIRRTLAPPVFEDEEQTRVAGLLNVILLTLLTVTVVGVITAPLAGENLSRRFLLGAVLVLLWLSGLRLIRHGQARVASVVVVAIAWLVITAVSLAEGGIGSSRLINYGACVVVASLLLGGAAGVVVAGVSILASLGMLLAQVNGFVPADSMSPTPTITWLIQTVNLIVISFLLYLAARSIRDSLQRARDSERALEQRNHDLESEIAERRQAEEALSREHALLRALMDNVPDTIYFKDTDARFTRINRAQIELLGLDNQAEALGKTDFDFFVAELAEQTYADDQQVLRSGQPIMDKVEQLTRMDGNSRWVSVTKTPLFDSEQRITGLVGVSRDISERVEAQRALRESEERFRSIFENTMMGLYRTSPDGQILMGNPALVRMLGFASFEELAERDLEESGYLAEYPRSYFLERVEQEGQIMGLEAAWNRADGSVLYVRESARAVRDKDENTLYYEGTVEDVTERVLAEQALRESEARFRRLAENAPDIIFRWTLDKGLDYVSNAVTSITGYTPEELRSDPMLGLQMVMGSDPEFIADCQKAIVEGSPMPSRAFPYQRKDGSTAFFDVRSGIVRDDKRNIVAFEGILRDVTERVHAEDALRENEARYRSLFVESPISLWEEDFSDVKQYLVKLQESGIEDLRAYLEEHPEIVEHCSQLVRIVDVNQETMNLFGVSSRDELYGGLERVFTPESFGAFRDELVSLAEGQTRYERQVVHRTLAGDKMHVVLRLVVAPGYEASWEKVFVSMVDITRGKQVEAERERLMMDLMRRGNQLLTAAEVSKSASTILDPEQLINETVNLIQRRFGFYYVGLFLADEMREYAVLHAGTGRAGRNMLEDGHRLSVGGESMIGMCVGSARARIALDVGKEAVRFDNPHLPETRSEMALPLISRDQCIGALTVQSREESAFSADDIASLQSMADQLAIAISNARLYEQVQRYAAGLEERVAERTAELAAVNKELEAFAYSVSHDLRAPLRSVDGFSQALLEDYNDDLDEMGRDYLRRVRGGSQRMGRLIDDLLKLSRLTRQEMRREVVDLSGLAQNLVLELQQSVPERNVEFVIAKGITTDGDAHLLRVAVENLLANAWKFTAKQAQAKIELGSMLDGNEQVYFVRDDGAGFDMTYADKLFGAFQRLHAVSEFDGTGIGLATVQRIIHRHGGRIWAEGAVGEGATFYFTLSTGHREENGNHER